MTQPSPNGLKSILQLETLGSATVEALNVAVAKLPGAAPLEVTLTNQAGTTVVVSLEQSQFDLIISKLDQIIAKSNGAVARPKFNATWVYGAAGAHHLATWCDYLTNFLDSKGIHCRLFVKPVAFDVDLDDTDAYYWGSYNMTVHTDLSDSQFVAGNYVMTGKSDPGGPFKIQAIAYPVFDGFAYSTYKGLTSKQMTTTKYDCTWYVI